MLLQAHCVQGMGVYLDLTTLRLRSLPFPSDFGIGHAHSENAASVRILVPFLGEGNVCGDGGGVSLNAV